MGEFLVGRVSNESVSWLGPAGLELIKSVKITGRQWQILWFIKRSQCERGITPSLAEIADAVGLSGSGPVSYQIRQLERKGLLRRQAPGSRRAIVLNVRF